MTAADLIIQGLGSEHLHGFLPGNDNRAAISRAVSSMHGWSSPGDGGFGEVTRDGIGHWGGEWTYMRRRPAKTAVLFVTWNEVLAVIERGCGAGHRAAYETAWREWGDAAGAWCRADLENRKTGAPVTVPYPDPARISATTRALIRHGCEYMEVQDALF